LRDAPSTRSAAPGVTITAGASAFSAGRGAAVSRGDAVLLGGTTVVAVRIGAPADGGVLSAADQRDRDE
jgi:hypothetical protein